MAKKVIYLSPSSHGKGVNRGIDEGCYEDGHTRPIAEEAAKLLNATGKFEAVVAKPGTSMAQRCAESDALGADLHVPVHTNAFKDEDVRYLLFMFYADTPEYRELFDAVRGPLEKAYPGPDAAVFSVRKDLYEISQPAAKTIYCELGFHTNEIDSNFIHDEDLVGRALAEGLAACFGEKLKAAAKKPTEKKQTTAKKETKKEDKTVKIELPQLEKGDKGNSVKAMQRIIIAEGYSCGSAGADGNFGDGTARGLAKYQKKKGLTQDGICGEKTWSKMLK